MRQVYYDPKIDDYRCPFDGAEICSVYHEDDGSIERFCEWGHVSDDNGNVSEE